MNTLLAFLPLAFIVALYWWGFRKFKSRHGPKAPGPQGQIPYGVHGLLAFFIFASYYISPLFALGRMNSEFMKQEMANPILRSLDGYGEYKFGCFVLLLVVIAWQIVVARKLRWELVPRSLKNARILCFSAPILMAVGDALLGKMTLDVAPSGESIAGYLSAFIGSSIWGLYFVFSRRCKNTYLAPADMAEVPYVRQEAPISEPISSAPSQPSPRDSAAKPTAARLADLLDLKNQGLISEEEYQTRRTAILNSI